MDPIQVQTVLIEFSGKKKVDGGIHWQTVESSKEENKLTTDSTENYGIQWHFMR